MLIQRANRQHQRVCRISNFDGYIHPLIANQMRNLLHGLQVEDILKIQFQK